MNKEKIQSAVQEAVDVKYKIRSYEEFIDAIAERMKDEEELPKARFKAYVKYKFDKDIEDEIAEKEELKSELDLIEIK